MIKVNWKNLVENLIITVIIFLIGAYVGHKTTKVTSESVVQILQPTIERAIDKETIKNEIKNEIDLDIEKIKKADSININISQDPTNDQKPTNILTKKEDCAITKTDFNRLSDREQRKVKRWIND